MLKKVSMAILFLGIVSCSGFFDQDLAERGGVGMNSLALADGSGYISTDDHNEINPYIFYDTNTGKKWLFFASDREGSYDIYYAEMDTDGKFSHPEKMDTVINTASDEFSPVVFRAYYNTEVTGLFISIAYSTDGVTNINTYLLNSDFSVYSQTGVVSGNNANRISIINKNSLYPRLLLANGEYGWYEDSWNSSSLGTWYGEAGFNTLSNINQPVSSIDGYSTVISQLETWADWYIFSIYKNGKYQICFGGTTNGEGHSFYQPIPYSSAYNDKDPFIDEDDFKVYFASDRYGKGNYDLYRYNQVTYDLMRPVLLSTPEVTLDSFIYPNPVHISWLPVPGATHYRIIRGEGEVITWTEVADITGLSYTDTDVIGYEYYFYKVQAINALGVSGISYDVGGYYSSGVY